jgi:uncharacterized membrane protein
MSEHIGAAPHGESRGGFYVRAYLLIAAPLLIAFCFLTGPFQVPDEPAHFYHAIQLSHLDVMPKVSPQSDSAGGMVERGAVTFARTFKLPDVPYDAARKFRLDQVRSHLNDADGARAYVDYSNTVIYFPLAHAGPAAVIAAARTLGASPAVWFYAGRLTNALAALAVSAIAIGMLSEYGLLALVVGLLPMTLFEEASLSGDALVIPFALVFAAILARIAMGRSDRELSLPLFACLMFVCVDKFAYIPLVLLPPGLALFRGARRSEVLKLSAISAVAVVIWLCWTAAMRNDVFNMHTGVHANAGEQIAFVLKHPVEAVAVVLRSMAHDATKEVQEMVGSNLGWLELKPPKVFVMALLALVGFAVAMCPPLGPIKPLSRALVIFCAVGSIGLIYVLLYLQYTAVGGSQVDGVQGRYLLPLIPLAPLMWPGLRGLAGVRATADRVVPLLSAAGAVFTVALIVRFYWSL